ncbi:MAG: class II glutamine amidotransferase [Bacteriovoracaceae bacterium]|nr:class II glutamine amidotransferase [Bacteriovoracaceae bacterium]
MCRFLAYSGKPLLMYDLLYGPKNSLIKQSIAANEAEEPLNGDGFGIGWYEHSLDNEPALYTSIRPAWNDRNLTSLSKKILSNCFFAHVRAANVGEVSEANCHPFQYKNFLFMHNGSVDDFQTIKRYLKRKLSDEVYNWVRGSTDSEHIFALFIHNLHQKYKNNPTATQMVEVLKQTIDEIVEMKKEFGVTSNDYINIVLSDGHRLIALRYITDTSEAASTLYFSEGSRYECSDGVCRMRDITKKDEHSVLIVSEKLTNIKKDWKEVPTNHFLIVDDKQNVSVVDYKTLKEVAPAKAAA